MRAVRCELGVFKREEQEEISSSDQQGWLRFCEMS